jgi:hypothetical protein
MGRKRKLETVLQSGSTSKMPKLTDMWKNTRKLVTDVPVDINRQMPQSHSDPSTSSSTDSTSTSDSVSVSETSCTTVVELVTEIVWKSATTSKSVSDPVQPRVELVQERVNQPRVELVQEREKSSTSNSGPVSNPVQPRVTLKPKVKRSFREEWKHGRPWLQYDKLSKLMSCSVCKRAQVRNTFTSGCDQLKKDCVTTHEKGKGTYLTILSK